MNYAEKLKDPRWQKKRLEIFERDGWKCRECGDAKSTLNIHHQRYKSGCDPWEYDNSDLKTLCEYCHGIERDQRVEAESILLDILKPYSVSQLCKITMVLCCGGTINDLIRRGDEMESK